MPSELLAPLEADGLVERVKGRLRPTRRWRAAMRRAAADLARVEGAPEDLRVPIALVMVRYYGSTCDDDALTRLVLAMAELEARGAGA